MLEYKLIRTRRRTAAVYVTKNAEVEVRAPLAMPRADIDRFVESRRDWIALHVEKRRAILAERALFTLNYADSVRLCGAQAQITPHQTLRGFSGGRVYVPAGLTPEQIKSEVKRAYFDFARELLPAKTELAARQMGVSPASVRVTGARAQWGSCSSKGRICYSWRTVMADERCIDYIIVHELAHILQHNHSQRFWAIVEAAMPDWRQCVERLSALQWQLMHESWN